MDTEIDELLEDEYAMQQMEAQHIHSAEVNSENENKAEIEISALLVDISETLRLLSEQMIRLNEVTEILPETVAALRTTTEAVQCISNELPAMIHEQCLEEYKKIIANAVKNYSQMRKSAAKWQRSIDKDQVGMFRLLATAELVTLLLLLLNFVLK